MDMGNSKVGKVVCADISRASGVLGQRYKKQHVQN